jgi:hypothetical protein
MATQTLDETKLQAFMGKIVGDLSGTMVSMLCSIGDRLGLFKDLSARGPATSQELAARAGIHERYAREWLRALKSAGYLEYDPASQRYSLPPEHAVALAQEWGPMFVGGMYQMVPAFATPLDQLTSAFGKAAGSPRPPIPSTSGMASSASAGAGSRTCSPRNGFRPFPTFRRNWSAVRWRPMSAVVADAR